MLLLSLNRTVKLKRGLKRQMKSSNLMTRLKTHGRDEMDDYAQDETDEAVELDLV